MPMESRAPSTSELARKVSSGVMKYVALSLLLMVPLAAQNPGPAPKAPVAQKAPVATKAPAVPKPTAATTPQATASFATWWNQFQAAVVKRDASTVSKGAKFPLQWENGPTRDIKVATAFAARFDFYFTSDIKGVIASKTPEQDKEGYSITWKARGNEYSLYFKDRGTGWALDGLSEGPP